MSAPLRAGQVGKKRLDPVRLLVALAVLAGALVAAGCGSSSSSSSSKVTSQNGPELHATVLEKEVAATKPSLEAVDVKLGKHTVSYAKGEPLNIALIGYGKGFDYTVPQYAAASDVAKEMGLQVTQFDPQADPQLEVTQIQSIFNSGKYNAMVVYPIASDVDCSLLTEQAPEKGIAVISIGYPACSNEGATPGLVTAIPDTPDRGTYTSWAERIVELTKKPSQQKALIVTGPKLDYEAALAAEVFEEKFGEAGIKINQIIDTDYTQTGSLPKVQDALQSNPDTTMIVDQFPEGTAATLTALKIAGKSGDIDVYGWGANAPSVKAIEDGTLKMAVPYYPYTNVRAALQALQLMRDGKRVPPYLPYAGHAAESMRTPGAKALFVEPDNVKEYAKRVEEY
ncbi:MAG: ribose transport system substrate-binding protein [Solirubrobacterales bacterium]|jgi:ABC-type sugar transport system substrate-binding protein|nr:ribose transport system substrate-binding protein [Solirubrobacterales bacterium]